MFDRSKFKVARDILPTISGWLLVSIVVVSILKYIESSRVKICHKMKPTAGLTIPYVYNGGAAPPLSPYMQGG